MQKLPLARSNDTNRIRICYFPGRESTYSRNRVLVHGMRNAGLIVHDCSHPTRRFVRYLIGFFKFLCYNRSSDIIFIGFLGQFILPIIKLLTNRPILFDAFVSVYQTMVHDRQIFSKDGLLAKAAKWVDRISCSWADLVILDTDQHIDYFVNELNLDRPKFVRVLVGSDDRVMYPRETPNKDDEGFVVHFHGEFQQLHGTDIIIGAAKQLPHVRFRMIGKGRRFNSSRNQSIANQTTNIDFIDAVPYEDLPKYIASADICLGIFGTTQKAQMVIPHKVYEAIACAKPVISADTRAARELFTHKEDIYLCRADDSKGLAEAILALKRNKDLRSRISANGHRIFVTHCSTSVLGKRIGEIVTQMMS